MRLFLKKILVLSLLCAVVAGAANLAFFLVKGSLTPANVQRYLDAPEQIQVANLGSSHGQNGFSYVNYPDLAAVNLAFGYQTLEQDERVLLNYIDDFASGSALYIPISSFSLIAAPSNRSDILSLNRRFYYFMRRDLIIDFSWREWLAAMSPGLFYPSWRAEHWDSDEFEEIGDRTAEMIDVENDAKTTIQGHILMHETSEGYVPRAENVAALTRMVRLCKERGVTPVLVTTPFLNEYNEQIPAAFAAMQQAFLEAFTADEQVAYLDFSNDSRFVERYDLFVNSTHLNDSGAEIFTDLLLSGDVPRSGEH